MQKLTLFTCVLVLLTLTIVQATPADYTVLNGSEQNVYLIVSTWMESTGEIPTGYRTVGYYKIAPGDIFRIGWGSSDYYIRMYKFVNGTRKLIKPRHHETRSTYTFWVEPKNAFTIVEKADEQILHHSGSESLEQIGGFYKYQNGGTFSINGDNLEAAKLAKVDSDLAEKKKELREINQQLARLGVPLTQVTSTGYTVLNGGERTVSLIVSTWMESSGEIPTGYRTVGYYKIAPGDIFRIGWGSSDYYIRMHEWVDGVEKLIKPKGHKTRDAYAFLIEPKNKFTVVQKGDGQILYGSSDVKSLDETGSFYKYQHGGTLHISGDNLELAKKTFELQKITRELQVREFDLAEFMGQFDRIGRQEVHALLILLGDDKKIRASVEQNESHMKDLLRQVSQYATVYLTVMTSEDEVTGKVTTMKLSAGHTSDIQSVPQGLIKGNQVDAWIDNLSAGVHDTILIYYNGHGGLRGSDDKHILHFDQQIEDEMLRATLRSQLEQKPGRLKMLITDTCSNRTNTTELMAKSTNFAVVRQRSADYVKSLFLQHKGILDLTAVEPGHYAWGSTDIGGYFTVALLQSLTAESDANQDRLLTWKEVFINAQQKTDQLFKQTDFRLKDKLMMREIGQKTQKPVGHSFPLWVE